MKTLRLIQITQDDINNGERMDRQNCMVARALKRAIPESFPRVDKGWFASIEVCTKTYRPSKEINQRIIAFDRGEPVKPFVICFDPKLKTATLGPDLSFVPPLASLRYERCFSEKKYQRFRSADLAGKSR
jgi:hypothetical protein